MVPRHVRSSEAVPVTTAEAESSTLVGRPSSGTPLDFDALWRALPELRRRYREATPFPHVVLDDFLDCSAAARAAREFPTIEKFGWINYLHINERKYANNALGTWGAALQSVEAALTSLEFAQFLAQLTDRPGLFADPSMRGGGLHQSVTGGFLNIHSDFTVHPEHHSWRRRVNLLLYLNETWPPEYGGDLEFWDVDVRRCEHRIAPIGNRVVIFDTDQAFHGHPEPLRCPPGVARQSLALYYFTEEVDPVARSTEYRARPGDGPRTALIYLDRQALRVYDRVKRRFGLSDRSASSVLTSLHRLRRRAGASKVPD
jgi:hypothetical protein